MSLFSALLGDFDDDGFMGNHMNSMNMQMRNMNRLMGNMIMPDPFNMLTPFDNGFNNSNSLMERGSMLGGSSLFGFPSMPNMNRLLSADIGNSGASFCSSSVISMSSGPDGRPQIYQATSSTKTGPGGIRETRKTVQDSTSGVKKMAIGHHIGDRAHIIEKEQNLHSGQHEERQEFINLEEEEAANFDREFTNKAHMRQVEMLQGAGHHSPHHRQYHRALPALPAPPSANNSSSKSKSSTNVTTTSSSTSMSPQSPSSASVKVTGTAASKTSTSTTSTTTANIQPSSSAVRRALRNASMATPRRPLRTPTSSPLALTTSGHNSTSTTTSVHPHPYNNAAARRNFRSKHTKHTQQHQVQQPSEPQIRPQQDDSTSN